MTMTIKIYIGTEITGNYKEDGDDVSSLALTISDVVASTYGVIPFIKPLLPSSGAHGTRVDVFGVCETAGHYVRQHILSVIDCANGVIQGGDLL